MASRLLYYLIREIYRNPVSFTIFLVFYDVAENEMRIIFFIKRLLLFSLKDYYFFKEEGIYRSDI